MLTLCALTDDSGAILQPMIVDCDSVLLDLLHKLDRPEGELARAAEPARVPAPGRPRDVRTRPGGPGRGRPGPGARAAASLVGLKHVPRHEPVGDSNCRPGSGLIRVIREPAKIR